MRYPMHKEIDTHGSAECFIPFHDPMGCLHKLVAPNFEHQLKDALERFRILKV